MCLNVCYWCYALQPQDKLGAHTSVFRDTWLGARRWTPQEGIDNGFLDFVAPTEEEAVARAFEIAQGKAPLSKNRTTYQTLKRAAFSNAATAFADGYAASDRFGEVNKLLDGKSKL